MSSLKCAPHFIACLTLHLRIPRSTPEHVPPPFLWKEMGARRSLVSISPHLACKKWHIHYNASARNAVDQAFPPRTSAGERLMDLRYMVAFEQRKDEGCHSQHSC